MLRRIPAVKWAFTRLRPLPHGGGIDDAVRAADDSDAIVADTAIATPLAEDDATISVVAESPSAAPTDISFSEAPCRETPVEIEPVVAEEIAVAPVEVENEPVDTTESVSNDPSAELSTSEEPAVAEEMPAAPVDIEIAPVDAPVLVVDDDPSSIIVLDVEAAVVDDSCVAIEIEPVPANDPAPAAGIAVEDSSADAPSVVAAIAPEPVIESPAPKVPSAPKVRAKIVEPADRATLIRQRWTETGIRMWNPRLHGTGDATLNIQGRIELLPPEPGETMPRYDKLEFKMLGGQIVCEGVIVEAPASAGQRSFTRLAEPRNPDRVREPVRERQAALA
ncbi:hypothetical protein [Bradyrhizobium sp. 1]|uniref:hypothetical protein n=1 Tax=Bradyrhizobium sp. 1 TaxID=241591 RepID=UPI001FFB3A67|nr:hypothetical protein [Bradyrhizobium sp. 1]MCK1393809.1 hypothetical protein [Bradyrhizobium sp. 1]